MVIIVVEHGLMDGSTHYAYPKGKIDVTSQKQVLEAALKSNPEIDEDLVDELLVVTEDKVIAHHIISGDEYKGELIKIDGEF